MSGARRLTGAVLGAAGLAAAGAAVGVTHRRRALTRRPGPGRADHPEVPLGSLRATPLTVVADDGVPLHVEVDEPAEPSDLTVVLVHGFALSLDCWHYQRLHLRRAGVRTVLYDQRSHGRSGRSEMQHATIEQLGHDLARIIDEVAPDGPVVVVGHSMGGMTVVALAEEHPELFGERVVGVGLVSTTAGGLDVGRLLLPVVPAKIGLPLARRTVATLARRPAAVDRIRRLGKSVAMVATDLFAFGDDVPAAYVEFTDAMLSGTPYEVVAGFFPALGGLDKFHAVEVIGRVPTTVLCGTADRVTSIGHSRKLHSRIAGSRLVEVEGAGHMVVLERHEQVDAELDRLLAAVREERVAR
ncbi:alpha/beta fold hydrolase [Nocardioides sp. zg-579]|uniref:Alpha/beta fold hydrolase n=1 Tax=Nocardioides marmotae TaxID=2663857 RepID=A0A6I3JDB1_9ACTN|nr:alpha/beta hydrolase [Nocardioides marmotae]MCR6032416.1 alpha/beta fold hydrolase [Gordonia jinghuaiqii]MTB96065.1 alpha/beta fold hydrolase [Nocardioides marmotae]QKE02614.1 alpha/beta hydrolase [Nocardioides marmotae]